MKKKVTVKDVAREAGVSVATVSYITNNRSDQKISEATRKKVLQIANLLNYTPSYAAKSLATGRNNIIGVSYRLNEEAPSRNLEITGFVNLLIERLNRMKYDVLFMPIKALEDNIPINRNIDGIITIELSHEEFVKLSDNYYVPIINIDMIINDSLFYQIYSDIPAAIEKAIQISGDDSYVISEKYGNSNYMEFISKDIPKEKLIIYSASSTETLASLQGKKVIIVGSYLALLLRPYLRDEYITVISSSETNPFFPASVNIINIDIPKKANVAINILMNAMDRKFDISHDHKIL